MEIIPFIVVKMFLLRRFGFPVSVSTAKEVGVHDPVVFLLIESIDKFEYLFANKLIITVNNCEDLV